MSVTDLTGRVFGRLRVIARVEKNDKHGKACWICVCSCGTEKVVGGNQLQRGCTRSCGCLRKEVAAARMTTHGYSRSITYNSYNAAKDRCRNPKNEHFAYYGGRGVEFRFASFEEFLAELGPRPPGMTVERIRNDGHYEIGNVRWASQREQNNNKRSNQRVTAFGRTRTVAGWARQVGLNKSTLWERLNLGWSPERAMTTMRTGLRSQLREALAAAEDSTVAGRGRPKSDAAGSEVR